MNFLYVGYEIEEPHAPGRTSVIYRPVIPVSFTGASAAICFRGLLDTGADETMLSEEMAHAMGAVSIPGARTRILSAGGDVSVTYAQVEIELEHDGVLFAWKAKIGIVEQSWDEALLGFRGFLEYFDVLFQGERLQVELNRNGREFEPA